MAYSKAGQFPRMDIEIAAIAKALSHPARVMILQYLSRMQTCICGDIVSELPLSQSTVSQHLRELKKAGLIKGEVDGPRVCYCLNTEKLRRASLIMNQLFKDIKCC